MAGSDIDPSSSQAILKMTEPESQDLKEIKIVQADQVAELDQFDVTDRQNARQIMFMLEEMRMKYNIALLVVSAVVFMFAAAFATDIAFQLKHDHYTPPTYFIEICHIVITSGLTFLGAGGLAAYGAVKKKKIQEDETKAIEVKPS